MVQFGGHAYAAGITLDEGSIDSFRNAINEVGRRILSKEDLVPELFIDAPLKISEISEALYKQINCMEPFGTGNPPPVFLLHCVKISKLKKMGRGESHARFQAIGGNEKIDAVGFNLAEELASIDEKLDEVDLVCELQVNDWNGRNKLELKIIDLKLSKHNE